jgi:hypothetical protein
LAAPPLYASVEEAIARRRASKSDALAKPVVYDEPFEGVLPFGY